MATIATKVDVLLFSAFADKMGCSYAEFDVWCWDNFGDVSFEDKSAPISWKWNTIVVEEGKSKVVAIYINSNLNPELITLFRLRWGKIFKQSKTMTFP